MHLMDYHTFVSYDSPRQFLIAAFTTKDLATHATMMSSSKGGEAVPAIITLPGTTIWHPVLLKVTVLVSLRCLKSKAKSNLILQFQVSLEISLLWWCLKRWQSQITCCNVTYQIKVIYFEGFEKQCKHNK